MPPRVDHAARRSLVAEVAADLIAESGLDAVTFREIARRAGFSTAIVSHYFADKRELLGLTYRASVRRARARFLAVHDRDPEDTEAILSALLPLDAVRRRDWQVWFAFWSQAASDPDLAAEQRRRVRSTRTDIAGVLPPTTPGGNEVDVDELARHLLVLIMGIAAQAVFDPRDWTRARQRQLLRDVLERAGYPAGQP